MDIERYRRVAKALAESQRLNAVLEARVREKEHELARQFEALQRLAREAAVAEERRRIMADMHDGVGSALIATLALVERGDASAADVAAALRECIDDLRLAIDSLEPAEGDLAPVLGGLRYRLEPRLVAAGIGLDWQVGDLPALACLTPQNVLHVLRILQEGFTNAVRHGRPRHIRVATHVQAGRVAIDVSDDGRGFDASALPPRGRGLGNMRQRARAIGGELQVQSSAQGTTLSLLLPVG